MNQSCDIGRLGLVGGHCQRKIGLPPMERAASPQRNSLWQKRVGSVRHLGVDVEDALTLAEGVRT